MKLVREMTLLAAFVFAALLLILMPKKVELSEVLNEGGACVPQEHILTDIKNVDKTEYSYWAATFQLTLTSSDCTYTYLGQGVELWNISKNKIFPVVTDTQGNLLVDISRYAAVEDLYK